MKKSIALLILILFFGTAFLAVDASGSSRNCPDGIDDYWRLDESSTGSYQDYISGNNGACDGGCPSPVNGVVNNGQLFDGVNDGITVAAHPSFDWSSAESFSIELWVQRDTGTISGLEAFVGRFDAAGLSWYIGINSSGHAQAQLKAADGSGPALPLSGSKDLRSADSTWHHVVFVRNNQTSQNILYVDGEQEASISFNAYSADFDSATAPLTLGTWNGGSRLSGRLDEIALYAIALDANQIKSHYYIARDYCSIYDAPVQIMAMGDSITKGDYEMYNPPEAERIGYRFDLWELLNNNLYWFDYIGSEQNGLGLPGIDPNFDQEHAGFGGISDAQLYYLLTTGYNQVVSVQVTPGPYLESYPTEIMLLHIGTNSLDPSSGDVENILNQIDAYDKNITVILARIIDQSPNHADVHSFNNNIETLANTRIAQGDKIIMVDMEDGAGLNYTIDDVEPFTSGDMFNFAHPNASGYSKIAGQWFATLETLLPPSDVPLFTTTPLSEVVRGKLYTYNSHADGRPSPDYSLISGPGGMTVDPQSGLVQWTPDTIGDFSVTLSALNWAGEDQQPFTISVRTVLAASDSYSGIMEGGSLVVSAAQGILANDAGENEPLSAILVSDVSHGTLNLNADGSFDYTHDGSEAFSDEFTYKASDGTTETDPATVTLDITAVNDAPVITGQGTISIKQGSSVTIELSNLVVDDPDSQVPDDLSVIVDAGPNYRVENSNTVVVDESFVGELNVSTRVTDGNDMSDPFDLVVSVLASGSGGGGGSGCFISSLF